MRALALLGGGLWAAAVLAQPVPRDQAVDQAQGQIDEGEFDQALRTLAAGLAQPELTDDQLAELYRLLGLAHLYLGNEDRARDAYEKLLQARPDYELPRSAPPKIRAIYARLKEDLRKRRVRPVALTMVPVELVRAGEPVTVAAHIEDLALGARAKLFYRRAGGQSFSSVELTRDRSAQQEYRATLPAFELPSEGASYEVEYYLEVADAAQRRLAGRGDSYAPLSFRVTATASGGSAVAEAVPWYKNPWVWVGVGVGAAAVTTGVVLLATQPQAGTLPIKIQVDGPL